MKRILLTSLLFLSLMVCATSLAWAGGLDDLEAGYQAYRAGNYDEAIRLYTKAIESGGLTRADLRRAYDHRIYVWEKKGDYDKAIADYTKVIELDPKDAAVYNYRGGAWMELRDYDRAIADFTKCIEIAPKYDLAYNNRGVVWRIKGDYDKAIADYTKAIEIYPEFADVYSNLAAVMATSRQSRYRDGKRAVELARKALKLKETPRTLDNLAAAYAEAGRFQEAIKTQEKAITKLKQEGREKALPEYEEHLSSYKSGKPWRER